MGHKEKAEKVIAYDPSVTSKGTTNYKLDGIIHAILSLGEATTLEDEQIDIIRDQARREAAKELADLTRDTKDGAGEQLKRLYAWIKSNEQ